MKDVAISIRKKLKKRLNPARYEHTLGVAYTAAALAMRYDVDLDKAQLGGLLHDCAREFDNEEIYQRCLRHGLPVSSFEEESKVLLHAKYGSFRANKKYKIEDEEILSAITFHTTGKANMTMLEKIVYLADYIEPDRDRAPRLSAIRKMAFCDIDEAIYMTLEDTLSYLQGKNGETTLEDLPIDAQSIAAYQFYKKIHVEKNQ